MKTVRDDRLGTALRQLETPGAPALVPRRAGAPAGRRGRRAAARAPASQYEALGATDRVRGRSRRGGVRRARHRPQRRHARGRSRSRRRPRPRCGRPSAPPSRGRRASPEPSSRGSAHPRWTDRTATAVSSCSSPTAATTSRATSRRTPTTRAAASPRSTTTGRATSRSPTGRGASRPGLRTALATAIPSSSASSAPSSAPCSPPATFPSRRSWWRAGPPGSFRRRCGRIASRARAGRPITSSSPSTRRPASRSGQRGPWTAGCGSSGRSGPSRSTAPSPAATCACSSRRTCA